MQADFVNPFARQVLPALLALQGVTGPAAAALSVLRHWDGTSAIDQAGALIFNAWMASFHGAVLRKAGLSNGLGAPVADFVAFVLSPAGSQSWCNGECAPLLRESLAAAVSDLTARFGADPAAWRWGTAHQAVFAHPLLRTIPVLGDLTTIRIPSGGDDDTVGRGGTDRLLQSVHGASYRGVYDLADLDRSLFMIAPGQSGNPFSRHARDFVARWRDGATITLGPAAAQISGTVQLTP
jgi:penicillin amidase